jgi:hypothetical protein
MGAAKFDPFLHERRAASAEARAEDLTASLAAAHAALLVEQDRRSKAETEATALRDLVADLCQTRSAKEYGTYDDALLWMRARAIARGEP